MFLDLDNPFHNINGLELFHFFQKIFRVITDDEPLGVFLADEAFVSGMVDEADDVVVKAVYIVEGHGLVEHPQLAKHKHLEELVHGTQSAGHDDKAIRPVFQQFFSFSHGFHYHHLVDFVMADVHVHQVLGDGARHLAVVVEHHISDDLHQSHATASVKQFAVMGGQNLSELNGFLLIYGVEAHAAAAKNANLLHSLNFCKDNLFYLCAIKLKNMRNIGILGAMAQEIDEVKALLTEKTIVKIANREFVVGKIGHVRCVVAFSKWGKVAATITATLMIQEFGVTNLIFIGTAGALADGLKVGDVVISKRLVQHDLDARPIISRFELPLLNRVYVDSDPDLTSLAGRAVGNLLEKGVEHIVGEEAVKEFALAPQLYYGDIASGDQFISSDAKRREILSFLPDVLCVEMEGAAVAQVCLEFGTPFTVIRTISDTADHNARVDFNKFIVEVANAYSRAIIGEIMRLL